MGLKVLSELPLAVIRAQEEQIKAKDAQLQQLGMALTEEKIKNAQKDAMIAHIGQEISRMKIEILALKGGTA